MTLTQKWIPIAIASGLCAAANGMFAKLTGDDRTTTALTTSIAGAIAHFVGLSRENKIMEFGIRAVFFGLNLVFNGIMWALFTSALKRSPSTTRVSIVNTSANFLFSALLGLMVFAETLPPLWWLGAVFLVAGNFFVGRRAEGDGDGEGVVEGQREGGEEEGEEANEDDSDDDGGAEGAPLLVMRKNPGPEGKEVKEDETEADR
ncbi:MAG: hypothetical protein M1840_004201 [Geoglossum simile]|nr:MAG: hypothetical protein M1840_004201 [Geoglossum simile]